MTSPRATLGAAVGLPALVGGAIAFGLAGATPLAAGLVAVLGLLAGALAWHATGRAHLALAAALVAALWAPAHTSGAILLALAAAVGLVGLVPLAPKALGGLVTATGAGAAGWLLTGGATGAGIGAGLGLLAAVARPLRPTEGHLRALRTTSLFLPALALVTLMAVNAVMGIGALRSVREVLLVGVGLASLFTLVGLAGLGLSTLLESDDPVQAKGWTMTAFAFGAVVATLPARDPSLTIQATAVAAVPVAFLAAIAIGRLGTDGPGPGWLAWCALGVTLVGQFGL